jgi:cytochrome P450
MDLSPVDDAFLLLAEPQIAEAIVYPSKRYKYSVPKSDTLVHLSRLIGSESLITRENEELKALRKRFNPGFQPKHIYSLTPSVVTKTQKFLSRLARGLDY